MAAFRAQAAATPVLQRAGVPPRVPAAPAIDLMKQYRAERDPVGKSALASQIIRERDADAGRAGTSAELLMQFQASSDPVEKAQLTSQICRLREGARSR